MTQRKRLGLNSQIPNFEIFILVSLCLCGELMYRAKSIHTSKPLFQPHLETEVIVARAKAGGTALLVLRDERDAV